MAIKSNRKHMALLSFSVIINSPETQVHFSSCDLFFVTMIFSTVNVVAKIDTPNQTFVNIKT